MPGLHPAENTIKALLESLSGVMIWVYGSSKVFKGEGPCLIPGWLVILCLVWLEQFLKKKILDSSIKLSNQLCSGID